MRRRPLGSHGPSLSCAGFGAWGVGGPWRFGWGPVDDEESVAAIRHAVGAGVNWIDTAAVYGLGHSEEIVGRAVKPFRAGEEIHLFTKCGRNWYGRDGEIENDLRPESIRFECEQSLRRLGVERIDLYQFHWPDWSTGTEVEESWATMGELVEEGKARWIGVSNFDVELLERCQRVRHVDSLQPRLNLLDRSAQEDVIPWCRAHGTGVIVYSPLASGLLTGAYDRERIAALPEDDWRRQASHFTEPDVSRNLALVEALRPIAERRGTSLTALAIVWTLATPGVTGAICGARRPEHVDGWSEAADLDLGADVLAEIEQAIGETGALLPRSQAPGAPARAAAE
jgi:aryl-alcohol dehydrogenase-like predicted oxidoreductase